MKYDVKFKKKTILSILGATPKGLPPETNF